MAFLIPAALAGLSFLVDGKSIQQSQFSSYGTIQKVRRGRIPVSSTIPASHIKNAPAYTIPSASFLEADNQRIADQLVLVDENSDAFEKRNAIRQANDPEVKKLLKIVTDFIKRKGLVVYGGTALNALLPENDKFYNYSEEIPDYDFFSPNAQQDAMELADIFYKSGYQDAQARSGVHSGTNKASTPSKFIFYLILRYLPILFSLRILLRCHKRF